jgi:hypothetical protein
MVSHGRETPESDVLGILKNRGSVEEFMKRTEFGNTPA